MSANWKAWTRQLLQMVKSRRVGAEEIVASGLPASLLFNDRTRPPAGPELLPSPRVPLFSGKSGIEFRNRELLTGQG